MASPSRPTDLPKSTHDTTYFSFGCKNIRDCILTSVGEITTYFVSSHQIENRWTSDGETAVFPLVPIQEKRMAKRAVLGLKNK